ncbi:MAG TPA: sensor histidine kinase [Cryptosporangiaceae bacterium]|nr:sensor histidine kinase [Cryptosporangiaceae bacterium]
MSRSSVADRQDADREFCHQALVYSTTEDLLAAVVPFIDAGRERGDTVLVVSPHADTVRDALASTEGVEFLDTDQWHQVPARTIAAYASCAQKSAAQGRRVRAIAEIGWDSRAEKQIAEWHRFESVLNHALVDVGPRILCPYDQSRLPRSVLDTALTTHPTVATTAGSKPSDAYLDPIEWSTTHGSQPSPPAPADALQIAFGAVEIPAVRRMTRAWAAAAGLTEEAVEGLLIAVYELASNAVEHGSGRGVARFWSWGEYLLCEVASSRPISDPLAGFRPPGTSQERGRGRWLVRQIGENVEIINGPTGATVRVWYPLR